MKVQCPHCHSDKRQIKSGHTRFGSQRFRCTSCRKDYTPQPKPQGHASEVRQQAVRLSLEGLSQRKVARILGVAQQSVGNWLAQAHQRVQAQALAACDSVVEMDELYTFDKAKKGKKTKNIHPGCSTL
jgi:transposase-like protein